jgi:hypothetical protein
LFRFTISRALWDKKSMDVGKKRTALKWLEIGNEFAKEEDEQI